MTAGLSGWLVDPFLQYGFMRSALLAGALVVVTTSLVGTWVVLRGLSFLGDALAHGVLPGVAIAFVAGVDTTAGALVAAFAMVAGINLVRSHSPLPEDTSIGILFVGFLALAVVIMSSGSAAYVGNLNRFLFGSVTGASSAELLQQAVVATLVVGAVLVFHRAFLVLTFDEDQAQLLGLRPRLARVVLLGLVAVAIVSSFRSVGSLLVFAFLIAPPATATMLASRVRTIMALSLVLGWAAVYVGLLISFHHDTAAAATMALVSVGWFAATMITRAALDALRQRRSVPAI